jgi:membrane protein YdbS with pleckstrin-like domain
VRYQSSVSTPDNLDWRHPSPRLWQARLAQLGAVTLIVVLAAGIGVGLGIGPLAALGAVVIVVALAGGMAVLLRRRFLAWRYAERDDDLLVSRGVMIKRLTVVPYGRMQFVDVTAGPVDRIFGLATVQLHTAAAATDAKIPGLTSAEAQRLRDQLAALGESRAAGL